MRQLTERLEGRRLFAVATTNTTVPIDDLTSNLPGLGETVVLDGTLHINRQTSSENGASVESVLFNPQGAAGSSQTGTE